ncbi:peroxiredoxin-like 2C [Microcaecilia unicolor]|uniref:Peroxiredoxin-like 2C n=1 Tax=Microcaecilia unicolor TaxID=1415580 RepID=A0A6P7X367_9AMPH|nr:peroxiredoxin-like 2C [Microcaecilia unicolor]
MASPIMQQIGGTYGPSPVGPAIPLVEAAQHLVLDRTGHRFRLGQLFRERRIILIFVWHFLCYTTKEYVEDLAKIPRSFLEDVDVGLVVIGQSHQHIAPFCCLTGYHHEIYVDPEREIYKVLGMKRGETSTTSGRSDHQALSVLSGNIKSIWRAMTGPAFDFQGDPAQQGGAVIVGPGDKLHFLHCDMNRMDHMPINSLLQLAGVETMDFTNKPRIIEV